MGTIKGGEGEPAQLSDAQRAALKATLPEVFTARGVDLNALRQHFLDQLIGEDERYALTWRGKRRAERLASSPPRSTLHPCPEESLDWARTRNLFIEGENLEALKHLQQDYAGQVKLIYIDPPYNTGKDFIYPDNFQQTIGEYFGQGGEKEQRYPNAPAESAGRFHTNWLNLIFPRLKLAHQLLTEDGVLMVSIDDHEVANLKRLCLEIFGEENYLSTLIWNKQHSQQQGLFKRYHEYVLVFAKEAEKLKGIAGGEGFINAGALKKISRANPASSFDFPAGVRFEAPNGTEFTGTFGRAEQVTVEKGRLRSVDGLTAEPVTLRAGWTQRNQMKRWFAGEETFDTRGQRVVEFYFNSAGKLKCRKKRGRITPSSILPSYGMVSESTAQLCALMGGDVFPTPKPTKMIEDFVQWFTGEGEIILDFFAGSATTAHAVMRSAARRNLTNQFIMVQLPEPLDDRVGRARASARYCEQLGRAPNIAELSKERIRRAAAQIREEYPKFNGDLGFKVFKLG